MKKFSLIVLLPLLFLSTNFVLFADEAEVVANKKKLAEIFNNVNANRKTGDVYYMKLTERGEVTSVITREVKEVKDGRAEISETQEKTGGGTHTLTLFDPDFGIVEMEKATYVWGREDAKVDGMDFKDCDKLSINIQDKDKGVNLDIHVWMTSEKGIGLLKLEILDGGNLEKSFEYTKEKFVSEILKKLKEKVDPLWKAVFEQRKVGDIYEYELEETTMGKGKEKKVRKGLLKMEVLEIKDGVCRMKKTAYNDKGEQVGDAQEFDQPEPYEMPKGGETKIESADHSVFLEKHDDALLSGIQRYKDCVKISTTYDSDNSYNAGTLILCNKNPAGIIWVFGQKIMDENSYLTELALKRILRKKS